MSYSSCLLEPEYLIIYPVFLILLPVRDVIDAVYETIVDIVGPEFTELFFN